LVAIDFDKVFDDIKQEDSFTALKKEDEINNMNVFVAIVFLSLIIWIAVFIARNNWRLKKLNQKIILQNEEVQQTLGALEQSQRENTRMMGMVAHDLRDPLGAIMNMAAFLLEEEQSEEERKECLTLIQTSSVTLLGMITDLLSTSITSAEMKKEAVDMRGLLHYCVDLLKFKANEKKQSVILHADDITLEIDREKIWRVISNLIANAIKFSPEGATIEVEMYKRQDTVQISIKDHGIGIPEEIKSNIFNVLSSVKRAGTFGERSFGLGLSISKQIVEALGGKIWFESKEGQGSVFYVEFSENMEINK
jgi:signal transduction histidine kinase